MSFEIRPVESFWRTVRAQLPLDAQEAVLDLLEAIGEHPGDYIDRHCPVPVAGAATLPILATVENALVTVRVVFKYGADEQTLYVEKLVVLPTS